MSAISRFVDHIYFINLDHRTDRKDEFLREMRLVGMPQEKVTRIPGIYMPEIGCLGCSKSHILALHTFLASPYERCIIFEDDFTWYNIQRVETFFNNLSAVSNDRWDIIMLSGSVKTTEQTDYPFLARVRDLQTSSSYCITKRFAPILLQNIQEGAEGLEYIFRGSKRIEHTLCLDIYWRDIQQKYKCFLSIPTLGFQRPSYSDIMRESVLYCDTEFKEKNEIQCKEGMVPSFQDYINVVQESSPALLIKLPHKQVAAHPSAFIVITSDDPPSFPFTICPLSFIKDEREDTGKNPHDVLVWWQKEKGSLEKLLYGLWERYKYENLTSTDDSVKRYVFEKKLPPRKIIIPTLHRGENLLPVLKRFHEIEVPKEGFRPQILVVEHSPNPEFEGLCSRFNVEWIWFFLDPRIPHVPIGQFNKALCYDKAFLFGSPAEWYLFHDNDVLVPKDFWAKLDANIERAKTKFIQPFTHRSLLNLYQEPAEQFRKNTSLADNPVTPDLYAPCCPGAPGGSLYIHHDRYLEVGGHDPNYCWGYGPEDAFFFHKCKLIEPIAYADDPPIEMIHLWHPPAASQNPFYRYMDQLIKSYFLQQSLTDMREYFKQKKALLNVFLPSARQRA